MFEWLLLFKILGIWIGILVIISWGMGVEEFWRIVELMIKVFKNYEN